MDYVEVDLHLNDPSFAEILEAELAEIGFESFQVQNNVLKAYIPEPAYSASETDAALSMYEGHITQRETNRLAHQNWNAVWESNYPPVVIRDLFVGAPFHPVPSDTRWSIVLEPNMSFGTGHHATTAQILAYMHDLPLDGKRFLDFGCGSAILSIFADRLGASGIGIEIDAHAADAARENLRRNNASGFEIRTGGAESIPAESFDVVAANINRNVIEETIDQLWRCMAPDATIMCSGFLEADIPRMKTVLLDRALVVNHESSQSGWAMLAAKKSS